jgi:hypothetical protein
VGTRFLRGVLLSFSMLLRSRSRLHSCARHEWRLLNPTPQSSVQDSGPHVPPRFSFGREKSQGDLIVC